MTRRTTIVALAVSVAVAVAMAACTRPQNAASPTASPTATPRTSPSVPPSPPPVGPNGAMEALAELCPAPDSGKPAGKAAAAPRLIRSVMDLVEGERGLSFERDVPTQAVTADQMEKQIKTQLNGEGYLDGLRRLGQALAVMGAVPEGTDLGEAVQAFAESQVLGYYDDETKRLVFISKKQPSPLDRFVLAHELLHALEDQHFDLRRITALDEACLMDEGDAGHALAEGTATVYSLDVVLNRFSATDQAAVVSEGMDAASREIPESVPPFVVDSMEWPYTAGMSFVQYLRSRGGEKAVNRAFTQLPASTEQIIHPAKYGKDEPVPVDIPDLAPALGEDWEDLAVSQAGEEVLSIYLDQRLDSAEAQVAAAGWGGGTTRAWTDGTQTAVVLKTVWDTPNDASQFGESMRHFLDEGKDYAEILHVGDTVTVLYGSDAATLETLTRAVDV